jgi:hypothetical protein
MVGVALGALGLWLLRGHYDMSFAFYRRYKPRPMVGLLCVGLGVLALIGALWPP